MENSKNSNIVLFDRSNKEEEDQDDVWDDRALIRAYERSIRKVKKEISNKLEKDKDSKRSESKEEPEFEEDGDEEEETKQDFDEENEGYYDEDAENEPESYYEVDVNNLKKKEQDEWKVEDLCLAEYSEDGLLYPANIVKIFESEDKRKKCIVKYSYYLNEEEKYLNDLYEYNQTISRKQEEPEVPRNETGQTKKGADRNTKLKTLPSIPPPPPLPANLISASDEDALHSMLLSWYLNGYHTGYYMGLKQANNDIKTKSK